MQRSGDISNPAKKQPALEAIGGWVLITLALATVLSILAPETLHSGVWAFDAVAVAFGWRARAGERAVWIALAAAVAEVEVLIGGGSGSIALLASTAHAVDILFAFALLRLIEAESGALKDNLSRYVAILVTTGGLAPALGGTFFSIGVATAGQGDLLQALHGWWAASSLGAAIIVPIILVARSARMTQATGWMLVAAVLAVALVLGILTHASPHVLALLTFVLIVSALYLPSGVMGWLGPAAMALTLALGHSTGAGARDAGFTLALCLAGSLPIAASLALERMRRESATLRDSEDRYRMVVRESVIGMSLVNASGRIEDVNKALAEMLGYPREELIGRDFDEFTHPADRDAAKAVMAGVLASGGRRYQFEKRYIRKQGDVFWAQVSGAVVRDDAGQLQSFVSQVEDVDARKRAEELLRASESRWSFALESAGQGVWDNDLVDDRCWYSASWKAMLGYSADDLPDSDDLWVTLVHPDDREAAIAAGEDHKAGLCAVAEAEFRMRHKDGHWVWVLDRGRVIEWTADGAPARMIGVQTDITRLKDAELQLALAHERMQLAVQAGGLGLWELTEATELIGDERFGEIVGQPVFRQPNAAASLFEFVHPDDRQGVSERVLQVLSNGGRYEDGYRIVRASGEVRHVRALARRHDTAQGNRLLGTMLDVTEQIDAAAAMQAEKERLRITLHSIGDAVICTDVLDRVTYMNRAAEDLTGVLEPAVRGTAFNDAFTVLVESTGTTHRSLSSRAMLERRGVEQDEPLLLVRVDGLRRSIRELASPVLSADGRVQGSVIVMQDVTVARAMQRDLALAASHDALTGLKNRPSLEAALSRAVGLARRDGARSALLFVDLDRFKIVNDVAGHSAGDALLRDVARVIVSSVPPSSVVARLGGDEFAIVLHGEDAGRAEPIADDLIRAVCSMRFVWDGKIHGIGASAGIAFAEGPDAAVETLMAQADVACYAAKAAGRSQHSVFRQDAGDAQRHMSDLRMVSGFRAAIDEGRLILYAQEIRKLDDPGAPLSKLEILTRIITPEGKVLPPGAFIPAAERFDMMSEFDRWVVDQLVREYGPTIAARRDVEVSVNLSANSLGDPAFLPYLEKTLSLGLLPPSCLTFEITESAVINNFAAAETLIRRLRELGCRVSLDDFGSGLSSFAYLKRFRVDVIKIDGSFVRQATADSYDRAIVRLVGEIGRELGLETVAESIEDEATLRLVRELGIRYGQGYLFHRPSPLTEILGGGTGWALLA